MADHKEIDMVALFDIFSQEANTNDDIHTKDGPEETTLNDPNSRRDFKVKKAYISKNGRQIPLHFRHFFMSGKTSEIIAFGHKGNFNFCIRGKMFQIGEFDVEIRSDEKKVFHHWMDGRTIRNAGNEDLEFWYEYQEVKILIRLDLDPWFGHQIENGAKDEIQGHFKIEGDKIIGFSKDGQGAAVWHGTVKGNDVEMEKCHMLKDGVKHNGKYNPDEKSIKGKIEGSNNEFSLTQLEKKQPQEDLPRVAGGSSCCNIF